MESQTAKNIRLKMKSSVMKKLSSSCGITSHIIKELYDNMKNNDSLLDQQLLNEEISKFENDITHWADCLSNSVADSRERRKFLSEEIKKDFNLSYLVKK
jgi:hypothetical protein